MDYFIKHYKNIIKTLIFFFILYIYTNRINIQLKKNHIFVLEKKKSHFCVGNKKLKKNKLSKKVGDKVGNKIDKIGDKIGDKIWDRLATKLGIDCRLND